MLRLTLRSGRDGRFLARIVDQGGFPFVLDFGDRRIIDDASQRLLHGFTMWRHGKLETIAPQATDLLQCLADFYAHEGLLVFLEEPTWGGRDHSLEDRLPGPVPGGVPEEDLPDDRTDLVSLDDLPDLDGLIETTELTDLGSDDDRTEERPWLAGELARRAAEADLLYDLEEPATEILPKDPAAVDRDFDPPTEVGGPRPELEAPPAAALQAQLSRDLLEPPPLAPPPREPAGSEDPDTEMGLVKRKRRR